MDHPMTPQLPSIFAILVLIFWPIFNSCQTLRKSSSNVSTTTSGMELLHIDGNERNEVLRLLNAQRLRHGVSDEGTRLHSYFGRIQCHIDGSLEACFVRSQLTNSPYFSSGNEVSRNLTEEILHYSQQTRGDLKGERIITADLVCDVTTASAPPYLDRNTSCYIHSPRRTNEGYLYETLAQETHRSIIDATRASDTSLSVQSNVICQWSAQLQHQAQCHWQHPNLTDDKKEEAMVQNSAMLSRALLQTHRYHRSVHSAGLRQASVDPASIEGAVICSRQNAARNREPQGQSTSRCRIIL